MEAAAAEAALLRPAHCHFARIEDHEDDRGDEHRDQQQGDERRREQASGLGVAAQEPG